MFTECAEYASVLVGKMLLNGVGYIHTFTTESELSTHFLIHTDIELCYMDMLYDGLVKSNGIVHLFLCRTIYIIVSLHSDTVDRNTSIFHLLYHIEDAFALHGVAFVVIVVEEQCLRIGLTCKLESLCDKLIAT